FDNGGPFGSLDSVEYAKGGLRVRGWAADPDTASPIDVNLYVNGTGFDLGTADLSRPDVAWNFPGYGFDHGFDAFIPWTSNASLAVCAYGINTGPAHPNTQVGCRPFARTGSPFGSIDSVTLAPGGIRVGGWSIDPDTTAPVGVHVYLDGVGYADASARGSRPAGGT